MQRFLCAIALELKMSQPHVERLIHSGVAELRAMLLRSR
jgi:hypothetical protein